MRTTTQITLDTWAYDDNIRRITLFERVNWYNLGYVGFLIAAAGAIAASVLS